MAPRSANLRFEIDCFIQLPFWSYSILPLYWFSRENSNRTDKTKKIQSRKFFFFFLKHDKMIEIYQGGKMKKNYLLTGIISLFFTTLVWLTMVTSVKKGIPFSDASIFEYFGYAMNRGELMYANLFDHKGPVVFLINYLGYFISGAFGIKILYLVCTLFFFAISFQISRLFTGNKQSIFVLLIIFFVYEHFFDGGWSLEGFILPLITYSLYIFLKFFIIKDLKNYEIVLSGLFFSVVLFTKANMIGIWLIFSLYTIIHYILMKNYGDLFHLVVRFLIGVFVFILPLFVYLISKGIFFEMLYQSIGINFIYTTESNSGSIKEILKWYVSESNLLTLNVIILISSLLSWEKYKSKSILYHIVFLLCLMLALVSKRSYGHYILVVIPLLIPYLASVFNLMKNVTMSKVLLLSFGLSVVYLSNINSVKESIRTRDRNSSYLQQTVANYIKSNTEFNDRIYTHRQNGTIYLYSNRLSSTKYFFIPAVTNDQILIEDFKKSIIENPPIYIVFDTEWDYGKKTDSFVKQYIHDNYKLEKQVETSMIYRKIGS